MARWAALFGLVVALAAALHWWEPFVTNERTVVTSTPSPGPNGPALNIPLAPGSRLCVTPAAIDVATRQAQVALAPTTQSVTLAVEASGPGYQSRQDITVAPSAKVQSVNGGLSGPPRNVTGDVCLRNVSDTRVALLGTNNPAWIGLARTTIDGRELENQAIALNLVEGRRQSLVSRLGTIVHRASDFTDGLMPFWLAWIVVVGLVLGIPFAVFGAFWSALRASETD